MKFKYIKTIQQGEPQVAVVEGLTTIKLNSNVRWEIVETGTTIPDEYKTIERTIPILSIETDSIQTALGDLEANGLQWLKDTFGASNVITE